MCPCSMLKPLHSSSHLISPSPRTYEVAKTTCLYLVITDGYRTQAQDCSPRHNAQMCKLTHWTSSSMSLPISLTGNEIIDASFNLYRLCTPSRRTWMLRRRIREQNCGTIRLSQAFIQTTAFKGENVVLRTDLRSIPVAGICCSHHRGSATLSWWAAGDMPLESTLEIPLLGKKGR